jgi:hypothetical protein
VELTTRAIINTQTFNSSLHSYFLRFFAKNNIDPPLGASWLFTYLSRNGKASVLAGELHTPVKSGHRKGQPAMSMGDRGSLVSVYLSIYMSG